MIRSATQVLLFAAPLTAAWAWLLAGGALGGATWIVPVALLIALAGAWVLHAAVLRHHWALIGLLVFTAFALNLSFRTREYGEAGLDWQNGVKLLTWLVLLGVAACNPHRIARLLGDPAMAMLWAFGGFALLSTAYSPVPAYSAACAIGILAYLSFACLVAREFSARQIVRTLLWTLGAYLVVTWLAAVAMPDFAFVAPYGDNQGFRLQGLGGHPNVLAKQAAVVVCLAFAARERGHVGRAAGWGLMALGCVTLLATGSRTALLAVVFACGLVWLVSRRMVVPALLAAVPVVGALALAGSVGGLLDLDDLLGSLSRTGDASEVLTMTGRTELWAFTWEKILEQPLLGHGFVSFEAIMTDAWMGAEDAAVGAHNTWLQAMFTLGLAGTLPLVCLFAILLWRWATRPEPLRDVLTIYLLITGMTEVEIAALPVLLNLIAFVTVAMDAAVTQGGWRAPPAPRGAAVGA